MRPILVVAMLIVVLAAIGAAVSWQDSEVCEYRAFPIRPPGEVPPPARIAPDGLKRYRSEEYRFSLFYPAHLAVQEYEEVGGARTIVFQDAESLDGFQIFIVPYRNSGIVPRRLGKDVNGVIEGMATSSVHGVCARTFVSRKPLLPNTVEVWVPKDGHLFEITVYEGQEALLDSIVSSWRFL